MTHLGLLASQVFAWLWPITAPICLGALILAYRNRIYLSGAHVFRAGSLLLCPVALVAWAAARSSIDEPWTDGPPFHPWELYVHHALAIGSVIVVPLVIWRSTGNRLWVSVWSTAIMIWIGVAWLTGGMTITNDWL